MTKWFDTNYHYLVPEFTADQTFRLASTKAVDEYREARAHRDRDATRALGPVSYLLLGKTRGSDFDPLSLLPRLLPIYAEVLRALGGRRRVLGPDRRTLPGHGSERHKTRRRLQTPIRRWPKRLRRFSLMLTTYFGALGDNLATALALPVHGLHVDLVRAPEQLEAVLAGARDDLVLSLGVIDGRNVWKADLNAILDRVEPIVAAGRTIILAPSCSLCTRRSTSNVRLISIPK